jgi:hypothetical protein
MPKLPKLKFPSISGPIKNKWIVDVAIPTDQSKRDFKIQLDRNTHNYDVFVCNMEQKEGITKVFIRKRENTITKFQEENFICDYRETEDRIIPSIQSIVESYGMLDLISSQDVFTVKNIITYDMRNQPLAEKTWNDVELSSIDFPQTNGQFTYEWVVSDRSFDQVFRFDTDTPYQNVMSITLKSPYYKNVLLIANLRDHFRIAYKELINEQFNLTSRNTPGELRQCIRSVLNTYIMQATATPTYAAGSQAEIWSCIGRLSDIMQALQ